ncbi:asparaginase [Nocardioides insulae]|uniref:asparaginase n=1 Tax=Nocardioides insulae TaxID=394734 RepID=UPI00048E7776|nr:asparaginase [Nocardioides insulae]
MSQSVQIAEIVRSGFVEGGHRGSVVALTPEGQVDWAVGDPTAPILPRSCNKPLQAAAMVRLGLDLPPELLALGSASHSGEDFHVQGVRAMLARGGLDESALQCPVDWPMWPDVREAAMRSGAEPSRLTMNCSGKHAAMLLTCLANGWSLTDYLDPEHPLQRGITAVFAELTGETPYVAVDGCGAPLLSASLIGLARAFRRLAVARAEEASDLAEHAVAEAIRRHPANVSGTTRDEHRLLTAMPGAIAKLGAEAVYVLATPDGRAWALKVEDGADRVRPIVMAAALVRSGVDREDWVDGVALRATGAHPLSGGGTTVGEIRALV